MIILVREAHYDNNLSVLINLRGTQQLDAGPQHFKL